MLQAVLTGRLTRSGFDFDLAFYLLSTPVSLYIYVVYIYVVYKDADTVYICIFFFKFLLHSLKRPFSELSLVGLALDLVELPLSLNAMMLLVGSYGP